MSANAVEPKVKEMLITKAATIAASEQGVFTAIISTERTDREGDVVIPEAMVAAIQAWNVDGKQIPLAWAHRTEPDELIGSVDPTSVKAENGEVIVSAWIDRDTPRGQPVWRLVKSQTLGFSFGYLVTDSVKRPNGDREIRGLDIFEISATATPMNRGTRVLDWEVHRATRARARGANRRGAPCPLRRARARARPRRPRDHARTHHGLQLGDRGHGPRQR
jgi:HK97 family phage prohead protease